MQEQEVQRTMSDYLRPQDAAALDRTIEREIIPRLLMSHRVGALPPRDARLPKSAGQPTDVTRHMLRSFLQAVRAREDSASVNIVTSLLGSGVAPDVIMMDLLAPTADTLGEMWNRDECDFVEVTVSVGRLQRILRELGQRQALIPNKSRSPGRVLLSSLTGEQHTLGLYIVAEMFVWDGWGVVMGPPTEDLPASQTVVHEWFDIVAFSVARDDALLPLRHEIAIVRRRSMNPRVRILIGGHAVNEHRDAVKLLGADASAIDPHDAVTVAHHLTSEASALRK